MAVSRFLHALRFRIAIAAFAALGPGLGAASPPPPLPPPPSHIDPAAAEAAFKRICDDHTVAPPADQVPVAVTALDQASLGFSGGKRGKLSWKWGVRLSSTDPRLHDLKGWDLDNTFGLVAVTGRGDWLTFDLRKGVLDQVTSIGVSPMRGVAGSPASLSDIYDAFVVGYADAATVDSYALKTCGFGAKAAPLFDVEPAPTLVVDAAYTYAGLVQPNNGAKSALELSYERHRAGFRGSVFPSVPDHHLVALSNPVKIVPQIVTLSAADDPGGEAVLQQVWVTEWDDVRSPGEGSHAAELGRLPRTPAAFLALQPRGGDLILFLAYDGPTPGVVDVYAMSVSAPFR